MTQRQLEARVTFWVKQLHHLGLGHWRFTVEIEGDPEQEFRANVSTSERYDHATIKFDPAVLADSSVEDVDEDIVHELLHVGMRDHDVAVESVPYTLFGGVAREAWGARWLHEREGLIERLARTIVALYS